MLVFDPITRYGFGGAVPAFGGAGAFDLGLNTSQYALLPGLCDVRVHLRKPGFSYQEPR